MTYILGTFKVKYFLEFVLQSMNQDVDAEVYCHSHKLLGFKLYD